MMSMPSFVAMRPFSVHSCFMMADKTGGRFLCQYLYFCTGKASKLSTWRLFAVSEHRIKHRLCRYHLVGYHADVCKLLLHALHLCYRHLGETERARASERKERDETV